MTHEHAHGAGHGGGQHSGHGGAGMEHAGQGHKQGVHGMLVVGAETVYLSHLPMFDHVQHDAQAILEVTFSGPGAPHAAYVEDRRTSGARFYTFAPDPNKQFVLADLVRPTPQQPLRRSFTGRLVRGHFERGGVDLVSGEVYDPSTQTNPDLDVLATVGGIVFFRQFEPEAAPLPRLTYLLFGKGRERFLAHLITRPRDFDQVLSVRVAGRALSDADLRHGMRVVVPGRANTVEERLQAGEDVTGELQGTGEQAVAPAPIQLEAVAEIYFEEGELRRPATFAPTEAELATGFS